MTIKKAKVTQAVATDVHTAGAALMTHTVNDPAEIDRLSELGVDGFYTDRYIARARP